MANVRGMSIPVDLGTKSIITNGTYNASADGLDGYSSVTVNVPANVGSKSIIENGTYNASADGLDGYSSVTVNVPSGVPIISRSAWDALTTEEKKALGLIAIKDSNTGFIRGDLVNGADYVPLGIYIPYTPTSNVICEAYSDIYEASSLTWGYGDNPINFSSAPLVDSEENALDIKVKTNGIMAYCDLLEAGTPFTAYVVMKTVNPTTYSRIISSMASRSSGNGMLLYGSTINVSTWGSDTSLNVPSSQYFAGVLQFSGVNAGKGGLYNNIINKVPYTSGRYITLGRTDINPDTYNAEPCDIKVKYIGITNSIDSNTVINNNLNNLITHFLS